MQRKATALLAAKTRRVHITVCTHALCIDISHAAFPRMQRHETQAERAAPPFAQQQHVVANRMLPILRQIIVHHNCTNSLPHAHSLHHSEPTPVLTHAFPTDTPTMRASCHDTPACGAARPRPRKPSPLLLQRTRTEVSALLLPQWLLDWHIDHVLPQPRSVLLAARQHAARELHGQRHRAGIPTRRDARMLLPAQEQASARHF